MGNPDRPPVLLVHGWGGSFASTWRSTGFDLLLAETGGEPIGVDLLGHGEAPRSHDPADYQDLTPRIVEHLGDRPVDAVGFSLGALTLLRVACERPGSFRRLVLGGIGRNAVEASSTSERSVLVSAIRGDYEGDDNLPRQFAQYAHQPGNDPESLAAALLAERPPFTADELSRVDADVLIVIGDRDFAGPGEPLHELIAGSRLITVARCDHFALTENFTFFDAVFDFLAE
jgi:pimeloyl-ACP methyl ester carboxylesterase